MDGESLQECPYMPCFTAAVHALRFDIPPESLRARSGPVSNPLHDHLKVLGGQSGKQAVRWLE